MTVILIILGIIIFLFFILRPILNSVLSSMSDKAWDSVVSSNEIDQILKKYSNVDNINYVIINFLKPLNIKYSKFASNLSWLVTDGGLNKPQYIYTPSIKYFTHEENRPLFPIWFIAAFPDICKWNKEDAESMRLEAERKLHENIPYDDLEKGIEQEWKNEEAIFTLKSIVENYLKNINPYLETR